MRHSTEGSLCRRPVGVCFQALGRIIVFVAFPLLFVSCGDSQDWSDVLDKTAPPKPAAGTIHSAGGGRTAADGSSEAAAQDQRASDFATPESGDPANGERDSDRLQTDGRRRSRINLALGGDADCFSGAVRAYVDGKYVGQFDELGKLSVVVEPGSRVLDVWDSRGRWQTEVRVPAGRVLNVVIPCEERKNSGAY